MGITTTTLAGNSHVSSSGIAFNDPILSLARYRAIPNSTARKIAWVGDSTTEALFSSSIGGYANILGNSGNVYSLTFSYPSGPFYNVTHQNFGANGASLSAYLANSSAAGKNLADIVAFAPDLIIFSFGINDVRLGLTTKEQLKERIITAINQFKSQLPNTDIILRMPNSFIYDSANTGTVIDDPISLEKVQNYSDIIRLAYRELSYYFTSNVYLMDNQGGNKIFSERVNTLANKGLYHNDAVHPSSEGYAAIIRDIILLIGDYGDDSKRYEKHNTKRIPLIGKPSINQSINAVTANATNPYYLYPRICEDASQFNLIYEGLLAPAASGDGYAVILSNGPVVSKYYNAAVKAGDILVQYALVATAGGSQGESIVNGVAAFVLTNPTKSENGNSMWLTNLGAGQYPLASKGLCRIYRARPTTQKNTYDPNFSVAFRQLDFSAGTLTHIVQRFGVCAVITGVSATAVTTGGTIDIQKNGTTFATLTWADGGATATVSGTFVGANTKGTYFDEGDIISAVINAGFVGGTLPKITLSRE